MSIIFYFFLIYIHTAFSWIFKNYICIHLPHHICVKFNIYIDLKSTSTELQLKLNIKFVFLFFTFHLLLCRLKNKFTQRATTHKQKKKYSGKKNFLAKLIHVSFVNPKKTSSKTYNYRKYLLVYLFVFVAIRTNSGSFTFQ